MDTRVSVDRNCQWGSTPRNVTLTLTLTMTARVQLKKNYGRESPGTCRQEELFAIKSPVVK
jgi:hypothetical protein